MNPYRRRVWNLMQPLLAKVGNVSRALDFGSGDGWFATQMRSLGQIETLTPVDVLHRKNSLVEPVLYDGVRLPFDDQHFQFSYSVDVLHHCPDPAASLRDLLRVTGTWFLIKDHTWTTKLGKYTLAALDELGNRKFGVPCLYKHQHGWAWSDTLTQAGFVEQQRIHPAPCHIGPMKLVNHLEYISLWRRG